jgi:hypothetical protein
MAGYGKEHTLGVVLVPLAAQQLGLSREPLKLVPDGVKVCVEAGARRRRRPGWLQGAMLKTRTGRGQPGRRGSDQGWPGGSRCRSRTTCARLPGTMWCVGGRRSQKGERRGRGTEGAFPSRALISPRQLNPPLLPIRTIPLQLLWIAGAPRSSRRFNINGQRLRQGPGSSASASSASLACSRAQPALPRHNKRSDASPAAAFARVERGEHECTCKLVPRKEKHLTWHEALSSKFAQTVALCRYSRSRQPWKTATRLAAQHSRLFSTRCP